MCQAIHSAENTCPAPGLARGAAKAPTSLLRLNTLITVLANCPSLVSLTISCSFPFPEWLAHKSLLDFQASITFVFSISKHA